ncbi:phosphotransferase family protein [Roseovarius nitratireducens]|uniref:phosphotransferase family protein n=1 Tax=Roseovarius nitratireducens TaxID=2044597 RepID=UPI000CE1AC1A|nr:phosphotransferase family protein [Roseovarius nitratireducens]
MSGLDTAALATWLEDHMPGVTGPVEAEKFSGGQSNPTYRLSTPTGRFVLRRKPPGVLLKSAHAVEREFRVQRALAGTDVPVAKVHVLCEDETVIGTPFYIMEEITGRIFDAPAMPGLAPPERGAIIDAMNRVLAAIHDVDLAAAGLDDYGPGGNYYARQCDRWTAQYRATATDDLPEMEQLTHWLTSNLPEDDGQRCLVHGDYRLDNLIFAPDAPEIRAVIDWELSTTGHPYADLAAVLMQWAMPATTEGRGLAGVDRAALGLWSDEAFVARYCERRGIAPIADFGFYLAFAHFRMAAILQGVKKRAMDGNAADPARGLRLGEYVPEFARAGLAVVEEGRA